MITEAEAQAKWCPFARTIYTDGAYAVGGCAVNRGASENIKGWSRCVASQCMAWRGVETVEFKARADNHFRKTGERMVSDTGFCGLAGQPAA